MGHKADLNREGCDVGGFGENQLSMMRSKITCRDLKQKAKSFGQTFKARGGGSYVCTKLTLEFRKERDKCQLDHDSSHRDQT